MASPILIAGLSGLLKGIALTRPDYKFRGFGDVIESAAREEIFYRGALGGVLGGILPPAVSAGIFAADHVFSEKHTLGSGAFRFADVFLGGMLYQRAFREHGLFGAVAAHTLHNLAVAAGAGVRHSSKRFAGRDCPPASRSKNRRR